MLILSITLLFFGCINQDQATANQTQQTYSIEENQNNSVSITLNSTDYSISADSVATNSSTSNITSNSTIPMEGSPTNPTSPFNSECRPENCTSVDWHIRARQLNIPNYQKQITHEGKLVLSSERFQIILPDESPNAEDYGRIALYQLRLAYGGVYRTLGYEPYYLPNVIKQEFALNHASTGSCCGSEQEGYPTIWNMGTYEQYLQTISLQGPVSGYLQNSSWNDVVGDHELTHRFNWGLGLSSFIDEGLANYVQDRGKPQPIVCREGGYEQGGQFYNYVSVCTTSDSFRRYNSGDCFWQRIEQLYGADMVQRIESHFHEKEERDSLQTRYDERGTRWANWTSFSGQILIDLNQAFVPEVGERFWTDFRDFGFSPDMAEGKTYASEAAIMCPEPVAIQ